jgi:hypothetical protein
MSTEVLIHVGIRVRKEWDDKLKMRFANDRGGRSRWYREAIEDKMKHEARSRKRSNREGSK